MVSVKLYWSGKYDAQGEELDLPADIDNEDDFNKFKEDLFDQFFSNANFTASNVSYSGIDLNSFGVGSYKNNKMNRKLNRVGKSYDKAAALKSEIQTSLTFHNEARGREIVRERSQAVRIERDVKALREDLPEPEKEELISRIERGERVSAVYFE